MRSKLLLYLFVFPGIIVKAQNQLIKGKVIDKATYLPISAATIFVNNAMMSASHDDGSFSLYISGAADTITVSHVNYQTKKKYIQSGEEVLIELEGRKNDMLENVTVRTDALIILKKAITAIPKNYPPKGYVANGIIKAYNIVNTSDFFYETLGIVRVFVPPSSGNGSGKIKIEVIQNKSILQKDERSRYINSPGQYKILNSFHHTPELVAERAAFIDPNCINQFRYINHGKVINRNRTVYHISFENKGKRSIEGNIYIDTAGYAFTAIDYIQYNIKRLLFVPLSIAKVQVQYDQIGSYWYLSYNQGEAIAADMADSRLVENFKLHQIEDSTGTLKPDYSRVMDRYVNNETVQKRGPDSLWKRYENLLQKTDSAKIVTHIDVPDLTNPVSPRKKPNFITPIFNYARNGNIYIGLGAGRFPYQAKNKKITEYGLTLNLKYRLYSDLYLGVQSIQSYGITGIKARYIDYHLGYNFSIGKNNRFVAGPFSGYTITRFQDEENKYRLNSWISGLDLSYKLSGNRHLFISGNYQYKLSHTGFSQNVTPLNYSLAIGMRLKL